MRGVALVALIWTALLGCTGCSGEDGATEVLDTANETVGDAVEDRVAVEDDLLSDVPFVIDDKGREDPGPVDTTVAEVSAEVSFDLDDDDAYGPLDLDPQSGICGRHSTEHLPLQAPGGSWR